MSKLRVYLCHPMEGLLIPEESQLRMKELIKLVGSNEYDWLLPEDWQASIDKKDIVKVDYMKWDSSDIVIADLWHIGLDRGDARVKALGSCWECGWTDERYRNPGKKKKKKLLIITRCPKNYHPFFESPGVTDFVQSVEEAALWLKEKKWLKK